VKTDQSQLLCQASKNISDKTDIIEFIVIKVSEKTEGEERGEETQDHADAGMVNANAGV
jgi:hypothetical protein